MRTHPNPCLEPANLHTCPQVRKYRPRVTLFWLVFECALSALMAACLAVLFVYALHVAPAGTMQPWYDVYDSVGYAPARYWLLKRNTAGLDGGALPLPGTAGRWALPEDASGLRAVAELYQQMDHMTYYWVLYGMLQVRLSRNVIAHTVTWRHIAQFFARRCAPHVWS